MKRILGLALAGILFFGVFSAPAAASGDSIKVMTRNQYLGADLTPLILAQTESEFYSAATAALQQIAANFFPLRAQRLATEVVLTEPDVIGLQEVFDFTVNGINIGPPFVDHLATTLAALAARGQNYEEAAIVEHFHLTISLPFDVNGDGVSPDSVSVLDRDVILVREGVEWENVTGLCGAFEADNPAYPGVGNLKLTSTDSEEGCNYNILAGKEDTPIGPISIERGFVAVDVTVGGNTYRVVNTHLEERQPDPTNPASPIIQSLQAVVLMETLQITTPADLPLILLGDFNSSQEDEPIGSIVPPYQIIAGSGFADAWNRNFFALFDPGYTCCQLDDLSNRRSLLDERIDIIFVRNTPFRAWAFVMGRVPIFPLFWPPNWASDHAGVFAHLIFR